MTYKNYYLHSLFLISNFYIYLPSDIMYLIHSYIINSSAQYIIDKWYSYINIHNINLCYIVNNLSILFQHDFNNNLIFYYDINDFKLYYTLKICYKYIKPKISNTQWWKLFLQRVFNGYCFIIQPTINSDLNVLVATSILNKLNRGY